MQCALIWFPTAMMGYDALAQKRPLIELLAEHPEIKQHVTRAQLASFCDPINNLGQAGGTVDRVLGSLKP